MSNTQNTPPWQHTASASSSKTHAEAIDQVYRLQSEFICVYMNHRSKSYGPIPEDALVLGVLAALGNLTFGNRRVDQWTDIRNLANDAIILLTSSVPSGIVGGLGMPVKGESDQCHGAEVAGLQKGKPLEEEEHPVKTGEKLDYTQKQIANAIARALDRVPVDLSGKESTLLRKARRAPQELTYTDYVTLCEMAATHRP